MTDRTVNQVKLWLFPILTTCISGLAGIVIWDIKTDVQELKDDMKVIAPYIIYLQNQKGQSNPFSKKTNYIPKYTEALLPPEEYEVKKQIEAVVL